jgi:arylsulfatase A-like enzyme
MILLVGVSLGACSPAEPTTFTAKFRLVDPDYHPVRTSGVESASPQPTASPEPGGEPRAVEQYPVVTIHDETRYVLAAPPAAAVAYRPQLNLQQLGGRPLRFVVPPTLRGARELILVPELRVMQRWQMGTPTVATVMDAGGDPVVDWQPPSATEVISPVVAVRVQGYALTWKPDVSFTLPPIHVSEDAVLQFGLGLLEPTPGEGNIGFTVEACIADRCSAIFSETVSQAVLRRSGWMDRSVPLADHAGQEITLVFSSRHYNEAGGSLSFPVWSNPTVYAAAAPATRSPNVILISLDTLRADRLSTYGYGHPTSPFMDAAFGRSGVVFEHCTAAATNTSPSHMSMMTGLQPSEHGVTSGLKRLPPWIPTLAELARAAGVETAAFTEDGWLGVQHGFGRGFNVYGENRSPDMMAPTGQVDATFGRAKEWLKRNRGRPFFLFLHTFQVHDPYAAPEAYRGLFKEATNPPNTRVPAYAREESIGYDQEIRYTDDELRMLYESLVELGLDQDTVFIVTADHGEAFGEHGYLRHSAHPYDEVAQVPLLFKGPGIEPRRVPDAVAHVDIAPTVLDLMRIQRSLPMSGKSLVPYLDGTAVLGQGQNDRTLVTETWNETTMLPNRMLARFEAPAFGVRRGSRKLNSYTTSQGPRYEYFDLRSDPHELSNLYAERASEVADLQNYLAGYVARGEVVRETFRSASARQESSPTDHRVELDPEQEEKLRALGYLQ